MTKQTFTFLLVPGLSMMSLVSAIEPLRSLNRLVRHPAYAWRFVNLDGAPVAASNEIALPAEPLEAALADTDYLFVCGGPRIKMANEKRFLAPLRQAARRAIVLGALSTGTYLLARAGLLKGYRCTIHRENRLAFREDFPGIACSIKLYDIDRERVTCSGGTAAIDLMLHLIADRHGPDLARDVANQFNCERIRAEMIVTEPLPLMPVTAVDGNGLYGRQTLRGNLAYGGGPHGWLNGFADETPPQRASTPLMRNIAGRLANLFWKAGHVRVIRSWAGFIENTPDGRPVIDRLERAPNVVMATMSGVGFGLSPAVGRVVQQLITQGACDFADIGTFRLARFAALEPDWLDPQGWRGVGLGGAPVAAA